MIYDDWLKQQHERENMSIQKTEKIDIGQLTQKLIDLTAIVTGLESVIKKQPVTFPGSVNLPEGTNAELAAENALLRELVKRLL